MSGQDILIKTKEEQPLELDGQKIFKLSNGFLDQLCENRLKFKVILFCCLNYQTIFESDKEICIAFFLRTH